MADDYQNNTPGGNAGAFGSRNAQASWDESVQGFAERMTRLMDNMPMAYVGTDRYLAIREANKHFNKLFGVFPSRYLSKHLARVIDAEGFTKITERLVKTNTPSRKRVKSFVLPLANRNGGEKADCALARVIHFFHYRLDFGGFQFFFFEDQPKNAMEALGQACASLSRELSKPANLIHTLTGGPTPLIALGEDETESVRKASARLQGQIERLSIFSQLFQENAFSPESVSLDKTLDRALEKLQLPAEEAQLLLVREIQPQADLIAGSPDMVTELFFQLLHNAWKFKHYHEKCKVYVQATRHGDAANILFRDSGIGITAALKEHIFDPFFQGPHMAEQYGGTGLGLAIASRIVELHGGEIVCDGSQDNSACFHLRLPAAPQQEERGSAAT